ncbi:MAG: type II toxin-antitoxin system HigB family toxin, partial [Pleurocapsa sp. SU_196_0]|nr:type II toxin-antitoxin system HigB family toxin [Pleurocapsa sp. SU_196_0]
WNDTRLLKRHSRTGLFVCAGAHIAHFHELKSLFGSADVANGFTIFDIGGNNYRLITDVDYRMGRVYR